MVIEMKTERELFEDWAKERGLTRTRCEDTGVYFNQKTLYAWEAWQASASRQGYKLVPLEMHWHKADDLASIEWDKNKSLFCSTNRDMTAMQVEEFRLRWCKSKAHQIMNDYKAMIGAADE